MIVRTALQKIEKKVGELNGVNSSMMNLMKQTLTVSVDVSAVATISKQIEMIVHNHEPEVEVSEYIAESINKKKTNAVKDDEDESKK